MSGQKYYQDGIMPYKGGFGKFYYNKTQGLGSPDPQDINWMSNINLSRTDRTKTMYVNPVGYLIPSHPISVTQNKSDLLLLVGCINGQGENNTPLDVLEYSLVGEYGCTYYVNEDLLSTYIDIVVLTNGNVLNASLVNEGGIINSVQTKNIWYYNIEDRDIPMFSEGNNPQNNQEYQQYPNLSQSPIFTYIGGLTLSLRVFIRARNIFDTITYNSNTLEVTNIDITSGGILYEENEDYADKNNLVAVKFQVELSSLEHAGTESRIKVVSAVYDSEGVHGVSSEYDKCKVLHIKFRLNTEGQSISGDNLLNFNEQGAIDGDHDIETTITSTVPWTIGETNTGSNE